MDWAWGSNGKRLDLSGEGVSRRARSGRVGAPILFNFLRLPGWRSLPGQSRGDFIGGGFHVERLVLPLHMLPDRMREALSLFHLRDAVSRIEACASSGHPEVNRPWEDEAVVYYRARGIRVGHCQLTEAYQVVPTPLYQGVLSEIRARLHEFLLQLSEANPGLKDTEA